MKYFTRKAIIDVDTNSITFRVLTLKDVEESIFECLLPDMKSYKIQYPTSKFACLTLCLDSGVKKEFSFLQRTFDHSQSDTETVIQFIHLNFKQFNTIHKETKQIKFEPSFYASKKGLYTISFSLVLLIIPITLAIKLNKSLPLTFFGSLLLIGHLVTRRMADLNFYKKMKND